MDAVGRAKSAYDRKNYRLASDILEAYISSTSFAALTSLAKVKALDLQAACYEKLGLLEKARRSSSLMLRLDSTNVLGYLRLGKILQLNPTNTKLAQAVKVYKRALQKLEHKMSEKQKRFFETQIKVCAVKISQISSEALVLSKRCDFVKLLPPELVISVFKLLRLKERIVCMGVSRKWQNFIASVPAFWTNIEFDSNKPVVLTLKDVTRYCALSKHCLLSLDFSHAVLRDPDSVLQHLARSLSLAPRLTSLVFSSNLPISTPPVFRMLRRASIASVSFSNLSELSITSDTPDLDIVWCLNNLASLKKLSINTFVFNQPPRLHLLDKSKLLATKLSELRIWGQSGNRVLNETLLSDILSLPLLTHIDVHRVVSGMWPACAPVLKNPNVKRMGFTSEGTQCKRDPCPFPRFLGNLESLTLNDVFLSNDIPLIDESGSFWRPNNCQMPGLKYIELKNAGFKEYSLNQLLNEWKCVDLETLVIHSCFFAGTLQFPAPDSDDFVVYPRLETLQYTNMRSLNDSCLEWIVNAFPNLKKVNLDGTSITGLKLLRLMRSNSVQAVKCKDICDMSADTLLQLNQLKGRALFN